MPSLPTLPYAHHPSAGSSRKGVAPHCRGFFPPFFPLYCSPHHLSHPILSTSMNIKMPTPGWKICSWGIKVMLEQIMKTCAWGIRECSLLVIHICVGEIQILCAKNCFTRFFFMTINNSQAEYREGNVTGAMAVQLRESGLGTATSVCVCHCDREFPVYTRPPRLPWSSQRNPTDAFVFSIEGIC